MLSSIKERLDRDDEGFTLIELMVVVLIIAILLAIAIPTFLSARNSANARAAQSNLRNALTSEQSQFTSTQAFGNASTMQTAMSSLQWLDGQSSAATSGNVVAADPFDNGDAVFLQALGKDNNCYTVLVSNDPSWSFTGYRIDKGSTCTATAAALTDALGTNGGTYTYNTTGTATSAAAANSTVGSDPANNFYPGW